MNTGAYRNNFGGYAIKRLMIAVITFFIISIIVFLIFNLDLDSNYGLIPINPLPEKIAKELHLNESLIIKYFRWMDNFFTGNFGESLMPASYYSE